MKEAAWLSRRRPDGGVIGIPSQHCQRCGRGLYIVGRQAEWGKDFCVGCDETTEQCYCPDTRQVA